MMGTELAPLTELEQRRFAKLEDVIRRGQQTFVEVGNALAEIRDSRLYKETHSTFEAYCRERWGWTRQNTNRIISASKVVKNLEPNGSIPAPSSEGQVRPLTKLQTPEDQYEAWKRAHEIADDEGRAVTGEVVGRAADEIKPKQKPSPIRMKDCEKVVAESHADKAISWINEIDLKAPGAHAALLKVVNYCNSLIEGLSND